MARSTPQSLFVAGDYDGFFGLAVDNLIQFLLIMSLCTGVLGFEPRLLLSSVMPAAALSMLIGNLYYARAAQRLSAQTGRTDVTALPYGINTVSLFAFVFLVMLPVKLGAQQAGQSPAEAATTAWQIGLAACFISGIIELLGAPIADWVRRHTPRAALLSALAGIAISFIAIDFAVRTFEAPIVALLPLAVILATYFGHAKQPLRIPGGAWAVLLGSSAAWICTLLPNVQTPVDGSRLASAFADFGVYPPIPVLPDLWAGLTHELMGQYLVPVVIPMGLINVLGSLQNLESAEAAGDRYPSMPCMVVNGLGSVAAAAFGSCFPTTIYIGHPGWKALGARAGYSVLNGAFFAVVALLGLSQTINTLIPIEAGMAIVLWIGLIITAQAFQVTPASHAPAVALGLFPAIAGWGVLILTQALAAAGIATQDLGLGDRVLAQPGAFAGAGLHLDGMIALSQGFMLTSLVWSAAAACLIDRRPTAAGTWMSIGTGLAFFGFIHAGTLTVAGATYEIRPGAGMRWAIGYALCAALFFLAGRLQVLSQPQDERSSSATGAE